MRCIACDAGLHPTCGFPSHPASLAVRPLGSGRPPHHHLAPFVHSQVGFFTVVALPLFEAFAGAMPMAKPLVRATQDNLEYWERQQNVAAEVPKVPLQAPTPAAASLDV